MIINPPENWIIFSLKEDLPGDMKTRSKKSVLGLFDLGV